jgi:MIP family channel proteins
MGNRLLAEIVGTFGFFFIGFSGIAASVNLPGSIAPAGVAAGFGLGLGLMIAAFGQISGGHFNPAVTFGLACARKFPSAAVIPYWIAQLIGGFIAVLVAAIIYTNDIKDSLVTNPGVGVSDWRAMLAELVAVFLFVSVIITVATDDSAPWKGVLAPVAIGGFIFVAAVTIGPTSGGSFNPARSIDPAGLAEAWQRYQMGEQNTFSRRIYTLTGQSTYDQVKRRIGADPDFAKNAASYMSEFEQLLQRAAQGADPVAETRAILVSDRGKVYTMLAHASGRLG